MDLGDGASMKGSYDGCSTTEILSGLRADVRGRRALLIDEWVAIVAWADQNVVDCPEQAATVIGGVIDTGVPIAGVGAPLVSEFNLMELIAVLGRSPDGGRMYVGRVIECAWRLPQVYAAVVEGRLAPWRAERIADLTRSLTLNAVEFVDRQLFNLGGVSWAQIERLVHEAAVRFDPERAEADRQAAADVRCFNFSEPTEHGLVILDAVLDAADGHDLDQAVGRRAVLLGNLGDDSSLDVRRSKAAAELARADLALDLLIADPITGEVTGKVPGRRVVLHLHLTDTAVTGSRDHRTANPVGRWEESRCPISTEQIREWLTVTDTTITVRPVVDLSDCVPVDSYEIPDRIRARVELRDHSCRFPGCPKPATRCDLDHCQPWHQGGATCPCQLVALCRRHHRAKTFSRWRYVIVSPGHYLWISPHGQHFLVGPGGTHALDPPQDVGE